ncbi:MAG TPA: flagellar biosynthetic protein FliP [Verrucomicrobia bacterium]|nr:MAG: flagellar biosynthetic protein FliP [Lentisphaerae bacterium GWF2_57_35]HBA85818.1 flagellar biosynthetic protein FliP [Verrucomicrobiota bacterium]
MNRLGRRLRCWVLIACLAGLSGSAGAAFPELASDTNAALMPMGLKVQFDSATSPKEVSQSIRILLLLTALSLAPSAIIMTTSFTRILIVLGFLRQALGTQQTPPAQVITGMALFLTIFVMMPIWTKINTDAIQPYIAEQITQQEAWQKGIAPLRAFMEKQVGASELALFVELRGADKDKKKEVPLEALIPAFMISELKTAFQLGFLIYLPFLVIDLVIASSLMSLGMMMLPPMMISLPIKLLFFVLADGWTLLIRGVVSSFSL